MAISERELFQKPSQELEVGYESGKPLTGEEAEVNPYTPYELDRLRAFEHIIRQANEMEARLNAGKPQVMFWTESDNEGNIKKRTMMWEDNSRMLMGMRNTAFAMYQGHDIEINDDVVSHVNGLMEIPHTKLAADQILHAVQQEKQDKVNFELAEINHMWEVNEPHVDHRVFEWDQS